MNGGGIIIITGKNAGGHLGTPQNTPVSTVQSFVDWCVANGVPSEYASVITSLGNAITDASS
jgi:hypothetical protein